MKTATITKTGADRVLTLTLKKDLPVGHYAYDFDLNQTEDVYMDNTTYGECGGGGFNAQSLYRAWARNAGQSGKDYSVTFQTGVRFLRARGYKFTVSLS